MQLAMAWGTIATRNRCHPSHIRTLLKILKRRSDAVNVTRDRTIITIGVDSIRYGPLSVFDGLSPDYDLAGWLRYHEGMYYGVLAAIGAVLGNGPIDAGDCRRRRRIVQHEPLRNGNNKFIQR